MTTNLNQAVAAYFEAYKDHVVAHHTGLTSAGTINLINDLAAEYEVEPQAIAMNIGGDGWYDMLHDTIE